MIKEVYLDHNGTTHINPVSREIYIKWLDRCHNPSSSSRYAKSSRDMIDATRDYVAKFLRAGDAYEVIFTSGASESNNFVFKSLLEAYYKDNCKKPVPVIITSAIEHESIISCLHDMEKSKLYKVKVDYIKPAKSGEITSDAVENTIMKYRRQKVPIILCSIMYANNETGIINDIPAISDFCNYAGVPFHSDMVQIFGKKRINLSKRDAEKYVDFMSVSMHKLYGAMGIGMLIIRKKLIEKLGIQALICGKQQGSLRGGTENVPAIATIETTIRENFTRRNAKNRHMVKMREFLLSQLSKEFIVRNYLDKDKDIQVESRMMAEILIIGNKDFNKMLPNTLLMAVVPYNKKKKFCNINLKKDLDAEGIVVSIGSACNTSSKNQSHVLRALGIPKEIGRGVIRVSLGDKTTKKEMEYFAKVFTEKVAKQL